MFQNSFQSQLFEVFNSKDGKTVKGNREKQQHYDKLIDTKQCTYEFDDQLKSYILKCKQASLPSSSNTNLALIHQYFGVQIKVNESIAFELVVVDTSGIRRRINVNSLKKQEVKPFFVTSYIEPSHGLWQTIIVDMVSFMQAFKTTYRSLEQIHFQCHCSIRKIFTAQTMQVITVQFPIGVANQTILLEYQLQQQEIHNIPVVENTSTIKKQIRYPIIKQKPPVVPPPVVTKPILMPKRGSVMQSAQQSIIQRHDEDVTMEGLADMIEAIEHEHPNNQPQQIQQIQCVDENIDDLIEAINYKQETQEMGLPPPQQPITTTKIDIPQLHCTPQHNHLKYEIIQKNPVGSTTITKLGSKTVIVEQRQEQGEFVKYIFDPILNCYYDPQTKQCYI